MAPSNSKGQQEPGFWGRHRNVPLYVPNLIGYVRVALALYGLAVGQHYPWQCIIAYFLSFVCDDLDGRFARALSQTSTLGAVLDMVTDRLATSGLLLLLAVMYPRYMAASLALIFLDIFSHWFQMYATLLVGASTHKDTKSASWLVRTYYKYRLFMGFCCVCCEVLYLALYGLAFTQLSSWRVASVQLQVPSQLLAFEPGLARLSGSEGVPVLALVAAGSLPGFAVKQICNYAQLQSSAALLVQSDLKKMHKQ